MIVKSKNIIFFVFSLMILVSGFVHANESAEKATKLLRSLCLAGDGYTVEADVDGSISIFSKGVDGSVKFSKKELKGVVDVSDSDRLEELNSIRSCIQPYIGKIIDQTLGNNEQSVKESKDAKKIFLYQNFSDIEEGLTPENWIVSENILVELKDGESILTSNPAQEQNKITIPELEFPEDFSISFKAKMEDNGQLTIKLSNHVFTFGLSQKSNIYYINKANKRLNENFGGQTTNFTIKKEGMVFRLFVNGVKKIVKKIPGFEKPETIEINFIGAQYYRAFANFELYDIKGKAL